MITLVGASPIKANTWGPVALNAGPFGLQFGCRTILQTILQPILRKTSWLVQALVSNMRDFPMSGLQLFSFQNQRYFATALFLSLERNVAFRKLCNFPSFDYEQKGTFKGINFTERRNNTLSRSTEGKGTSFIETSGWSRLQAIDRNKQETEERSLLWVG